MDEIIDCACGCLGTLTRLDAKGRPRRFLRGHQFRLHRGPPPVAVPLRDRFWKHVEKTESCWLWIAARDSNGYGRVGVEGARTGLAHRAAWELTNGPIPPHTYLCHTCDNPPCVRPDHLFLGNAATNAADMVAKGRHGYRTHPGYLPKGERHYNAKLTAEQVATIRTVYRPGKGVATNCAALSREYGVSSATIMRVVHHTYWR